jgi:hypothetical protein
VSAADCFSVIGKDGQQDRCQGWLSYRVGAVACGALQALMADRIHHIIAIKIVAADARITSARGLFAHQTK